MKSRFSSTPAAVLQFLALSLFALAINTRAQLPPTDPSVPVVTLITPDSLANEAGDPGAFRLFRYGPTNLALNVFWMISGSASNGMDYQSLPAIVNIPAGVREVIVPVVPIEDKLVEGLETVAARLFYPPIEAPQTYEIGWPSNAVVAIFDNDPSPTNRPPFVSLLAPTDGAVFSYPDAIQIIAGALDPDLDDYVDTVEFFAGTNSLGVRTNCPLCASPVNPFSLSASLPPGDHGLTAKAADNHGASSTSDPVHVRVLRPTQPVVRLVKPLDGQMFLAPTNVLLRAETLDPDGYVDHIEFYAGTNQIGEETRYYFTPPPPGEPATFEMFWTNPPPGRHLLTARARDDQGVFGISSPVVIWVVETNLPPFTNLPPIVTIWAPDPIAAEGTNCCRWIGWSNSPPVAFCGTNTATIFIRRTGPTNDALTVHYRIGGTASNGVDYVALPGLATIPAGQRAVEFKLVPLDDALPERLETAVLSLRAPPTLTSDRPPYVVGLPARAAAVIVDNDAPRPLTGVLADRCFHLMKPGPNGSWWRIECSADMLHWTTLGTNSVTDGALHFVDPDADERPNGYYRAVPCDPPLE